MKGAAGLPMIWLAEWFSMTIRKMWVRAGSAALGVGWAERAGAEGDEAAAEPAFAPLAPQPPATPKAAIKMSAAMKRVRGVNGGMARGYPRSPFIHSVAGGGLWACGRRSLGAAAGVEPATEVLHFHRVLMQASRSAPPSLEKYPQAARVSARARYRRVESHTCPPVRPAPSRRREGQSSQRRSGLRPGRHARRRQCRKASLRKELLALVLERVHLRSGLPCG